MDAVVTALKFENKAVIPTDPRTKLFLTVTVSTIMITGGTGGFMNLIRPSLMACPIVFLLLSRKWTAAGRFAVTYAILFALELTVFLDSREYGILFWEPRWESIRTCFPALSWDTIW